ncbi:MAG: M42 family metallopeptidase [Deltaproteobacteria bacterium]|jgi:endoglucanase|nr:M42 family metallopeptidase [Deltaproteobacteria bacterium]MDA8308555.1 M42 family metallopeptidase [Deltaproteobacteria bacterium]
MNDSMKEKGIELLEKLSQAHGAPGQENEVRRIFRKELGEGVHTDRAGNIFCEKKGAADHPRILIAAHMDEVGLAVQSITDEGLIRFVTLGGWWAHTLLAKRVRIRTDEGVEIPGVIGAKPPHFLSETEREKVMNIEEMFIDVGARDADEARAFGIGLGDAVVPDSSFTRMRNPDLLLSKAFDDRAGLSAAIQAAVETGKTSHPNTVIFAGTVQEEVGTRGARAAAFSASPDLAIVVEGAPADDFPGVGKQDRQAAIGCGPQIRFMDPSAILNREFIRFVIKTAEKNSIPYQLAVRRKGGTDAAPIHLHARGVPTVVIAVPSRYVHTHNTILDISDYLDTVKLIIKLIETIDGDTTQRIGGFSD